MTDWDKRFLGLAQHYSTFSKDPSTQTGAVIVRPDNTPASFGFNGFARGMKDDPAMYANREEKYERIIHCEMNAEMFAKEPLHGYTLYTYPFLSCARCFVHLAQKGIVRFVAPKCPEHLRERWEDSFQKVRNWAGDYNPRITIDEIEYTPIVFS